MPQLSDLIGKRTEKKFVKKSYRPWDLSGTGSIDTPIEQKQEAKVHELTSENEITGNESGNITDNNQVTTKEQPGNNKVTPRKRPDNNQATTREHLDNKTDNGMDNILTVNYLTDTIKKLTGIQKNIFLHIINICTLRGALDTGNILTSDLALAANCSFGSAKTSLIRLLDKKLIIRHQGKACRGGHMVLGITKEIQAGAIQAQKSLFNPLKTLNPDNITGNNSSYSSSNSYNINTTTSLPSEWEQIDLTPLMHIGFSKTQLTQLFERQLNTPEIIQASINHFAFALDYNLKVKIYAEPLNVLMGVLRKGGVWFEKNYVSPKEKALSELLEHKKLEAERLQKLEKDLIEEGFKIWIAKLSVEEKEDILGAQPRSRLLSGVIAEKADRGHLFQHFMDNVHGKD